jgi:predicted esterase
MMTDSARNLPIFFGHGQDDPVVQFVYGKKSYEFLKSALKMKDAAEESIGGLSWHEYPNLEHSTSAEELKDLEKWLENALPGEES